MKKSGLLAILALMLLASPAIARSGCCSHHEGVMANGCGCNDGTPLSSTCAPYYVCTANQPQYIPQVQQQTVYPTSTPIPTKVYIKPTSAPLPTRKITPTPTIKPTATATPTITPKPTNTPAPTITKTVSTKQVASKTINTGENPQNSSFFARFMGSALKIAFSQFSILSLL